LKQNKRIGPCIPNFYPKFRVGFRVGTSFRESGRVFASRDETSWISFFSLVIFLYFPTRPTLIFAKKRVFRDFFTNICKFLRKIAIFASSVMFEKLGYYRNISEIWKTAISETRENKNFGKNRPSQGLTKEQTTWFTLLSL
jgi:hypothetical protein